MAAQTLVPGLLLTLLPQIVAGNNTRFHEFFPDFRYEFTSIRENDCQSIFRQQQHEPENIVLSGLCLQVLDCMLEHSSESLKGNMASATVALGLLPTILTFLGSNIYETATLSRRRPLLSLLIACGSPAFNPFSSFTSHDPLAGLKRKDSVPFPRFFSRRSRWTSFFVALLEYVIVLAAAANVIVATSYFGLWTVNTMACPNNYLPNLWVVMGICVHLGGILAWSLRVERVAGSEEGRSVKRRIGDGVRHEVVPSIQGEGIVLRRKRSSLLALLILWCTSVGIVAHLLFGTIAFSSVTFISVRDAVKIDGRLMASAVVCRIVLMFELAGMRNAELEEQKVKVDERVESRELDDIG